MSECGDETGDLGAAGVAYWLVGLCQGACFHGIHIEAFFSVQHYIGISGEVVP
jgi:hypothetical protein